MCCRKNLVRTLLTLPSRQIKMYNPVGPTRGLCMLYPARSILAIDTSPFGRSLGLLPAMRALRASYPKTFLVAAATTGTCELLTAAGLVDDIVDLGVIKSQDGRRVGSLGRLVTLTRRLRRYSFDLALDFSPGLETLMVSRLLIRARTITPSRLPRVLESLLAFGAPQPFARPESNNYTGVLEKAGIKLTKFEFGVLPSADENARFERFLTRSGSRGGEILVLLYGSDSKSGSGWPVHGFGEVGARLANNFEARIVAADGPSDRAFTDEVPAFLPAGSLTLVAPHALELTAAIARASILVTDDEGVARLATELATPVIEVKDSTRGTATWSKGHRIVQGSSRARVSADEVYEIACEMIQESRSSSLFDRP